MIRVPEYRTRGTVKVDMIVVDNSRRVWTWSHCPWCIIIDILPQTAI
jgi:hypothetical protein